MKTTESRAREMLAEALEDEGFRVCAEDVREEYSGYLENNIPVSAALSALARALTPAEADDTTVERVAEAIHDARWGDQKATPRYIPWIAEDEQGQDYCRRLARAALTAAPRPADEKLREAGRFLLDRLMDHEIRMTSDDDAREWFGHITPAMARFRAALADGENGNG